MKKIMMVLGLFCGATVFAADTWFVDCSAFDGDVTGTGSETSPFRTIGRAVAQASSGDSIVIAPGDYGDVEGKTQVEVSGQTLVSYTRILVDKKLVFRAKDLTNKPRIIGRHDVSASGLGGMGADAVRCMWFTTEANNSEIRGIEFVDGASGIEASGAASGAAGGLANGGALYAGKAITVVDCIFRNCRATRGAAIYAASATCVRCLFKGGRAPKYGAAVRASGTASAYNCVFDDNTSSELPGSSDPAVFSSGTAGDLVNCTFVNNGTYIASGNLYNCLVADVTSTQPTSVYGRLNNCVISVPTSTYEIPAAQMCVQYARSVPSNCEVFSPLTGDYRLMPNAASRTAADADYLEKIPEGYRDVDFCGNPRLTDAVVYCGAVQGVAARFGGGLSLTASEAARCPLSIDGKPVTVGSAASWAAKDTLPAVFELKADPVGGAELVAFSLEGSDDRLDWPRLDGATAAVMPPVGTVKALSLLLAPTQLYVDPVGGNDGAVGDKEHPWLSLQKALNSITNDTVIHVARGAIAPPPMETAGKGRARLLVANVSAKVRIVADEGPSATSIVGAADPSPVTANDYGLGPNAVRCILLDGVTGVVGFQGFALIGGRTAHKDDSGVQMGETHGGAMYGNGKVYSHLIDCVISDCNASRGAACTGVWLTRCRISDCTVVGQAGILRDCAAVSTLLSKCRTVGYAVNIGACSFHNSTAYNCTIMDVTDMLPVQNSDSSVAWNCILSASQNFMSKQKGSYSNVLCSVISPWTGANETVVGESPVRVRVCGPYAGALRFDSLGVSLAKAENAVSPMDLNGAVFDFAADGSFSVGALNPVAPQTNYVDAVNGVDEEGRGGTAATAFKTLAYAMDRCEEDDTLVALPGVYSLGSMLEKAEWVAAEDSTPTLVARVVVKPRMKLVSAQGADETVIEGAADGESGEELVDSKGNGPKAVRCVFLCKGATLEGFTLRNGHTDKAPVSGLGVNDIGGGVWGYDSDSSLVSDCAIANCSGGRSGAGAYAAFRRCRVSDCTSGAEKTGVYFRAARLEGCFVRTGTALSQTAFYMTSAYQSTFCGFANRAIFSEGKYDMFNCVSDGTKIDLVTVSNCVFNIGTVTNAEDNVRLGPIVIGDVQLDSDGRPGAGSSARDAGSNGLLLPVLAGGDLGGNQRIMNRTVDAGCWEYDCRRDYAHVLKPHGVTVTDVSSDVVAANGGVEIAAGPLSLTWEHRRVGQDCNFKVEVTGTGTLTVSLNGQILGTYAAQDGLRIVQFESAGLLDDLTFTYVPGMNDVGVARISSLKDLVGLLLLFR